jgi:putative sigma-54 modulation protein
LVGVGNSADLFTAIHLAAEKLEKQCVKARTKFRDAKRTPHKSAPEVETDKPAEAEGEGESDRQVYKVKPAQKRKPMTVEEAVLEMDKTRDYLVYRDAQTDKVSVLVRRRDGHFDLVEG